MKNFLPTTIILLLRNANDNNEIRKDMLMLIWNMNIETLIAVFDSLMIVVML